MKARHRALFRAPRRQTRTAARLGRRGLDPRNLGLDPLGAQRFADDPGLPMFDKRVAGVLHLAAAAGLEMPAGRGDPIGRRRDDPHLIQPLAIQGSTHHLSRQGHRRKDRAGRDSVALMSQPFNHMFRHAAPISATEGERPSLFRAYSAAALPISDPMKPPDCRPQ